ncbi:MAG: hypothetical protein OEY47_06670 [Candidatus Bathyarchaeota archaeon]|nr:hypothetical protein [Candidatus Bathyarchaeota archaeon]
MSSRESTVSRVIEGFDKTMKETKKLQEKINELPEDARELARRELAALADLLCQKYGLTFPQVRQFLHEMLEVSI